MEGLFGLMKTQAYPVLMTWRQSTRTGPQTTALLLVWVSIVSSRTNPMLGNFPPGCTTPDMRGAAWSRALMVKSTLADIHHGCRALIP